MFWFWLSHQQGNKIQGILHYIWVHIFIKGRNSSHTQTCRQAHTKSHTYSKIPLIQPTQNQRGGELSNILDYQTVSTLISVISVLAGNYLFLLLYLGCTTKLKIIPIALSPSAGSGSSGSPSEFSEASWLNKLMKKKTGGQEIPQWLIYGHSWRPFWTCPRDPPISMMDISPDKKANILVLGPDHTPQEQDNQNFWIMTCQIKGIFAVCTHTHTHKYIYI